MKKEILVEKRLAVEQEFDALTKEENGLKVRLQEVTNLKLQLQGKHSLLTELIDTEQTKEKK